VEVCKADPNIDLIMMDMKMPDMDGYEATRQIRLFNEQVVIIAQTAFGLPGDRSRAIKAGCNDFMAKPISVAALMELIQSYFKL
jgi:CheY-like chemotaxis protein